MGKRFGRNQRRKLRDRVAELEQGFMLAQGITRHVARERDQLRDCITDVERVLGLHHVALPPKGIAFPCTQAQADGLTHVNLQNGPRFEHYSDQPSSAPIDYRISNIHVALMHVSAHLDATRPAVHCIVQYLDNRWAYAITEQALQTISVDRLAAEIAPQIAAAMKRDMAEVNHG